MQRSKSIFPEATSSTNSSAPTKSAPASSACFAISPLANTATLTSLPIPLGRLTTPLTVWSD